MQKRGTSFDGVAFTANLDCSKGCLATLNLDYCIAHNHLSKTVFSFLTCFLHSSRLVCSKKRSMVSKRTIVLLFAAICFVASMYSASAARVLDQDLIDNLEYLPRQVRNKVMMLAAEQFMEESDAMAFAGKRRGFGKKLGRIAKSVGKVVKQVAIPVALGIATGGIGSIGLEFFCLYCKNLISFSRCCGHDCCKESSYQLGYEGIEQGNQRKIRKIHAYC